MKKLGTAFIISCLLISCVSFVYAHSSSTEGSRALIQFYKKAYNQSAEEASTSMNKPINSIESTILQQSQHLLDESKTAWNHFSQDQLQQSKSEITRYHQHYKNQVTETLEALKEQDGFQDYEKNKKAEITEEVSTEAHNMLDELLEEEK